MARLLPALPFDRWPEVQQAAWRRMLASGDLLDERGPANGWRPATIKTNRVHYGRWLSHIGACSSSLDPTDLVTSENVKGYLEKFRHLVSPVTAHGAIVGISVVVKAMSLEKDWSWLSGLCSRLSRAAIPQKDKLSRMVPIARIYQAAIADMRYLLTLKAMTPTLWVRYRNVLMVALLAARPVRLSNFVSIRLGQHLTTSTEGFLLRFLPKEVKNSQELVFDLPQSLIPFLQHYLEALRQGPAPIDHDCLWVNRKGGQLSEIQAYCVVMDTTERLVGVRINPHLFRDCAATSLAEQSTSDVFAAAALLGHRDFSTTQRHYIRVEQKNATRRIDGILDTIRARPTQQRGK